MNENPSQATLFALVLVLFPVTLFVMVFLVNILLAGLGGWRRLAAAYPASGEPPGEKFPWRSFRLGIVNYNNCLNLTAARSGLHVATFFFLRLGHRPFFLPWSELEATRQRGWILEYVELRAHKEPGVRIRIQRGLAEQLFAAAGQPLPPP